METVAQRRSRHAPHYCVNRLDPAVPLVLIQATLVGAFEFSPVASTSLLASLAGSSIAGMACAPFLKSGSGTWLRGSSLWQRLQ